MRKILSVFLMLCVSVFAEPVKENNSDKLSAELQYILNNYINDLEKNILDNSYVALLNIGIMNDAYLEISQIEHSALLKAKKNALLNRNIKFFENYIKCYEVDSIRFESKYFGSCTSDFSYRYIDIDNHAKDIFIKKPLWSHLLLNIDNSKYLDEIVLNKELFKTILATNQILINRYAQTIKMNNLYIYPSSTTLEISQYLNINEITYMQELFLIGLLYELLDSGNLQDFLSQFKSSFNFYAALVNNAENSPSIFFTGLKGVNNHLLFLHFLILENIISERDLKEVIDDPMLDSFFKKNYLSDYFTMLRKAHITNLLEYYLLQEHYKVKFSIPYSLSKKDLHHLYTFVNCRMDEIEKNFLSISIQKLDDLFDETNRGIEKNCLNYLFNLDIKEGKDQVVIDFLPSVDLENIKIFTKNISILQQEKR